MAISRPAQPEQKNVCVNPSMNTVFFQSQALAYNYKTQQWTRLPGASTHRWYSVQDPTRVLGMVQESDQAMMIHDSSSTAATPATATMVTADFEMDPGFQSTVDGCQPLGDGISVSSVRMGVADLLSDSVTWSTGSALNTRTGFAGFRGAANYPTGAYHRAELTYTGGFTTVSGAYFEFFRAGRV